MNSMHYTTNTPTIAIITIIIIKIIIVLDVVARLCSLLDVFPNVVKSQKKISDSDNYAN